MSTLEMFQVRIGQRDHKLVKRAKVGKMNRFDEAKKPRKVKVVRLNNKHGWLDSKEE